MTTVKLNSSIPVPKEGGGTINVNELTLPDRLKTKHLKKLPSTFFENEGKNINPIDLIPFMAALLDLPESSIDEIDIDDLSTIAESLPQMLTKKKFLKTGEI